MAHQDLANAWKTGGVIVVPCPVDSLQDINTADLLEMCVHDRGLGPLYTRAFCLASGLPRRALDSWMDLEADAQATSKVIWSAPVEWHQDRGLFNVVFSKAAHFEKVFLRVKAGSRYKPVSVYEALLKERKYGPEDMVAVLIPGLTAEYVNSSMHAVSHMSDDTSSNSAMVLQWRLKPSFVPDQVRPFPLFNGAQLGEIQADIVSVRERSMVMHVKQLTGSTLNLSARASMSIGEFKNLITIKSGIPSDQQRLIFSGHQLMDDKTFEYYNMEARSTIHLVLKLRGD